MISVCMASYNGQEYIEQQIFSILKQLGIDDELIISDDCSLDKTVEIIQKFEDSRIKLIQNNTNFKNYNFNFENALSKAKGNIIFLADQDDVWLDNKINVIVQQLDTEKVDLIVSNCYLVDKDLVIIKKSYFDLAGITDTDGRGVIKNFIRNRYLGCCMAFNRKVLEASLPFPKEVFSHDTWIGLVGEMIGKTYFLKEPLIYFRRHGENFSAHNSGDTFITNISPYSLSKKIIMRFKLLKMLILRFIKIQIER